MVTTYGPYGRCIIFFKATPSALPTGSRESLQIGGESLGVGQAGDGGEE